MARTVTAAVEDLIFRSKISETAATLGAEAHFPRTPDRLLDAARESPPELLILDLASERYRPLELLRTLASEDGLSGIPTVGFLPHVEKDLARAAREAGCNKVMARSAFTKELPEIISGQRV